jgi:hypothetical protein
MQKALSLDRLIQRQKQRQACEDRLVIGLLTESIESFIEGKLSRGQYARPAIDRKTEKEILVVDGNWEGRGCARSRIMPPPGPL